MNQDPMVSTMLFAVEHLMDELSGRQDEPSKIVMESLRRSQAFLSNIKILGFETCGVTYEDFCKQLEQKTNIIFLSDHELSRYRDAVANVVIAVNSMAAIFKED